MSNTPHLTVYIGMIYAEQVISVIVVLTRLKFSRFLLKGANTFHLCRQLPDAAKVRKISRRFGVLYGFSLFSLERVISKCNFTKRIWRSLLWGRICWFLAQVCEVFCIRYLCSQMSRELFVWDLQWIFQDGIGSSCRFTWTLPWLYLLEKCRKTSNFAALLEIWRISVRFRSSAG